MKFLILFVSILAASTGISQAEPVLFSQNISCQSQSDHSSVKIAFNPNEFPQLGRPGGIHVELNTGIGNLSQWAENQGLVNKPGGSSHNLVIRRSGEQGQLGNWIEQDLQGDPNVLQVSLVFTDYVAFDSTGNEIAKARSFLSTLRISRSHDYGYGIEGTESNPGLRERDSYLLSIRDDSGEVSFRFQPGECGPLK